MRIARSCMHFCRTCYALRNNWSMASTQKPVYSFGPFQADTAKRLLLKDGEPVQVTTKVFDTLLLLLEYRGQVVEKDLLLSRLWPDTIVEEKNLAVNISALRK